MQIRDIMSRDVEIASPDMSIVEAAAKMRDRDTGFLPVGDNDRLVGTITDRDITVRVTAAGKDPNGAKVRDAMSEHAAWCFDDQDTKEAAKLMGDKQIHRLPVVNRDKRLVGIISIGDLARAHEDEETLGESIEEISEHTGKPRRM